MFPLSGEGPPTTLGEKFWGITSLGIRTNSNYRARPSLLFHIHYEMESDNNAFSDELVSRKQAHSFN